MAGRIGGVLVGIFLAAVAETAVGQSLADVARTEAARRQQASSAGPAKTKVLTNADLPASAIVAPTRPAAGTEDGGQTAEAGGAPMTTPDQPAAEATRDAGAPLPAAAADAAPTDDEPGWRDRAGRVNTALAAARTQVRQLKALSDRLSLEAQASNPAIAASAQAERAQLRAQIAQAEEKAAEVQALHATLVHDARTAGVPPAWIQ